MLWAMRRRTPGPVPDVFETFSDLVDSQDEAPISVPAAGAMARSAGVTIGLMVATCLAFVGGAWAANGVRPELYFANLAWEGVVILGWAVLWGALAAAATLAVGFLLVGVPWVRRQRGSRPTSTSTP